MLIWWTLKFLGFFISNDLSWAINCWSIVKRCHMHLHFWDISRGLALIRGYSQYYHSVIESVSSFGNSVWFACASSSDIHQLERIVRQASCIVGGVLPSITSLYSTRRCSRARKIIGDPMDSANCLCEPLPSVVCGSPSLLLSAWAPPFHCLWEPLPSIVCGSLSLPLSVWAPPFRCLLEPLPSIVCGSPSLL